MALAHVVHSPVRIPRLVQRLPGRPPRLRQPRGGEGPQRHGEQPHAAVREAILREDEGVRAAAWATGSQIVRFSKGANEIIKRDFEGRHVDVGDEEERVVRNPEYDPELHCNPDLDVQPFIVENPGWSIVGIARGKREDEEIFELRHSHVVWREIDDASHLDPPKSVPPDRPRRRTTPSDFSSY